VGLPTAIHFLGLSDYTNQLLKMGGLGFLLVFIGTGMALLYRFGPSQPPRSWWRIMPGTLVATLLWLLASVLFSLYVGRLATYDVTYGPIGAVAGVMMWFYVSVYVVLLGGELNAALDVYLERAEGDSGAVAE
jgi:membrane protein